MSKNTFKFKRETPLTKEEEKRMNDMLDSGEYDADSIYDILMDERNLGETLLTEGTKYDKKAIKKLTDSGLFNEETSTNIVNALFKEDIHAFVHSPAWLEKYLVGIVNMLIKYCNGDNSKAQKFLTDSISDFEEYLTYVKDVRPKLSSAEQAALDKKFNEEMSYDDLLKELETIRSQREEQSKDELSKMDFKASSNFRLVPINSYEEFHRLFGGRATGDGSSDKYAGGGGTAWCHTNNEATYNQWVDDGKYKFFVLENKDWSKIPFDEQSNNKDPKDDYGNSLIAILVNTRNGRLKNATLRCNHVGVSSNADNQYKTYAELSKVAGFNVENAVLNDLGVEKIDPKNVENIFDGTRASLDEYCEAIGIYRDDLTEFKIPDSVTSIGVAAFASCTALTSVTIPDSVTSIGDSAFYDCARLKDVQFKGDISKIEFGDDVFKDTPYKEEFEKIMRDKGIGESLISYKFKTQKSNLQENKMKKSIHEKLSRKDRTKFITLMTKGLMKLGYPHNEANDIAIVRADELDIGGLYDTIENIVKRQLQNTVDASTYKELHKKGSIKESDESNIEKATSILRVKVVDEATIVKYCKNLGIPKEDLVSVKIPKGATEVGYSAFKNCVKLTNVELPSTIKIIGESAFENCNALKSIKIPDGVKVIDESAFGDCSELKNVKLPDSVKIIHNYAFCDCTNLENVKLGNEIESIWDWAFLGCDKLLSIRIPDSVINLGVGVFDDCTNLTSITIPKSVTSIGEYAFYDCLKLKDVQFKGDVSKIKFGEDVFANTPYEEEFEKIINSERNESVRLNDNSAVYSNINSNETDEYYRLLKLFKTVKNKKFIKDSIITSFKHRDVTGLTKDQYDELINKLDFVDEAIESTEDNTSKNIFTFKKDAGNVEYNNAMFNKGFGNFNSADGANVASESIDKNEDFKYSDPENIYAFLQSLPQEKLGRIYYQYNTHDNEELAYIISDEDLETLGYIEGHFSDQADSLAYLDESISSVKNILEPLIVNGKIRPFKKDEKQPRGFAFKSSNETSGEVSYNGTDYAWAIVDGKLRVMTSAAAGSNWSETIYNDNFKEDINDEWVQIKSKLVQDSDGFYTDYTLWHNAKTDTWECIFGDNDLYTPENEYPDAEFDAEEPARDWFDNYKGYEDEEDLHFYEDVEEDNPHDNGNCETCGRYLTDGGFCPYCDDGYDDEED